MFKNAVFQGVGVRAIASVGALKKLEEHNFKFQAVAGVSGGAIVAALYAAGYTAKDMEKELLQQDFSEFLYLSDDDDFPSPTLLSPEELNSFNLWKLIKLYKKIKKQKPSLLEKQGVYTTKKIYDWMEKLLKRKNVETFGSLQEETGIDLKILAANVTKSKHEWFDKEKHKGTSIAQAVSCSVSIPIFFEPITVFFDELVDGGILSTFPISVFSEVSEETVGFKFPQQELIKSNMPPLIKFILRRIGAMWLAHDQLDEVQSNFLNNIVMDTGEISSVKFSLNVEEKQILINSGYQATQGFYEENKLRDYQKLLDLLNQRNWLEANQETFNLMLKFCGKEKEEWFSPEDIQKIECDCLNTIDNLWRRYSNNRFGFRPQKKVWDDAGKPPGEINFWNPLEADLTARKWLEFGKKVGWWSKFSLAPKDPIKMKNTILQANNIEDIPLGNLPNSILFWYGLGLVQQAKSISKQSLVFLATLYSRLEECQKS